MVHALTLQDPPHLLLVMHPPCLQTILVQQCSKEPGLSRSQHLPGQMQPLRQKEQRSHRVRSQRLNTQANTRHQRPLGAGLMLPGPQPLGARILGLLFMYHVAASSITPKQGCPSSVCLSSPPLHLLFSPLPRPYTNASSYWASLKRTCCSRWPKTTLMHSTWATQTICPSQTSRRQKRS